MADPMFTGDDEGQQPAEDFLPEPDDTLEGADEEAYAAEEGSTEPEAEYPAVTDEADSEPAEAEPDESAAATAAADQQATQDALFATDTAPVVPADGDESVTSFGGPPDDLEAIRADLGTEEEEADAPAEDVDAAVPAGGTIAAAAEAADEEALEATVEAGVPEGDDDAPEAVEALLDAEDAEGLFEPEPVDRTLSLPFLVYDAIWLIFAVAMVVVLRDAAVAGKLDAAPEYPLFVLVGLVLTVIGPLLAFVVWLLARRKREGEERRGLLAVALLRGSLATFAGVALWWAARVILDYFRTGRIF